VNKENINLLGASQISEVQVTKKKGCACDCNFTPFILMMALSFHSIFEGIALGLMGVGAGAYNLILAVFIHKFAEGVSLSIALGKVFKEFRILFWLLFIFSFATPLGISLGLILENSSEIVSIIFTSMAGGTFLYIACSEMVVEEFSMPGNRFGKLMAFLFGAGVITCLWFLDREKVGE